MVIQWVFHHWYILSGNICKRTNLPQSSDVTAAYSMSRLCVRAVTMLHSSWIAQISNILHVEWHHYHNSGNILASVSEVRKSPDPYCTSQTCCTITPEPEWEEANKSYHTRYSPQSDHDVTAVRATHVVGTLKVTCGRLNFCYWLIQFWLWLYQGQFQFVHFRYIVYNLLDLAFADVRLVYKEGEMEATDASITSEGGEREFLHNSCMFVSATTPTTTQLGRGGAQRRPLLEEKLIKRLARCQLFGTRKAKCRSAD